MPYIRIDKRLRFDRWIDNLTAELTSDGVDNITGNLNYIITKLFIKSKPKRYKDYNELIGVLECCKLEFYRRVIAEYEHSKKLENGDVYE
jgi:hypothetical protein